MPILSTTHPHHPTHPHPHIPSLVDVDADQVGLLLHCEVAGLGTFHLGNPGDFRIVITLLFFELLVGAVAIVVAVVVAAAFGEGNLDVGLLEASEGWQFLPVVLQVDEVALVLEDVGEFGDDEAVVRVLVEVEAFDIFKNAGNLLGQAGTEFLGGEFELAVHDHVVLLELVLEGEALPGQFSVEEVHQHVTDRLEVVPTRLVDAQVGIKARVTDGAYHRH
jgi:hypothetical protein